MYRQMICSAVLERIMDRLDILNDHEPDLQRNNNYGRRRITGMKNRFITRH